LKPSLISSTIFLMSFGVGIFQANASDERIGIFSSPTGKLNFGVEDIQNAEVAEKEDNAILTIYLHKKASEALGSLTERSISQRMTFAVCGEKITDPVVREPILSGILSFYGLPADQIKKILNTLKGNSSCSQW